MTSDLKGKKVYVGLSGGVDSSVSAYLLKQAGYDVTGVFIKVWQPDFVVCTWAEDRLFAMRVAAHLDIPFVTLDLEEEYKKSVIDYMLSEYKVGRTPNPDVMCNREVKFGAFLRWAIENGTDYIATGHYARINKQQTTNNPQLLRGIDEGKDQSYFLWTLTREVLKHVLFPVGDLQKTEVRAIARKAKLPTADKKDSQGLCFISNVDMKEFLAHFIEKSRGDVLGEEGNVIGFHDGALFFTLGERHGFTITKKTPDDKPYYVVGNDVQKNTITVSNNQQLTTDDKQQITLEQTHYISGELPAEGAYEAQALYHGKKIEVEIRHVGKSIRCIVYDHSLLTPGQSLVLYQGDTCLGGGIIE